MEVIKHGNTYREKECPGCGALLSYCALDIKREYYNDYFNRHSGECHDLVTVYIICPECNEQIILSWVIDGEETIK